MGSHFCNFDFAADVAKQQVSRNHREDENEPDSGGVQRRRDGSGRREASGRPFHMKIDESFAEREGCGRARVEKCHTWRRDLL